MLITDGPLLKLGIANPIAELLRAAGITVELFSDIEPDPSIEMVLDGVQRLKRFKPDAVIALGGGSPIDGGAFVGHVGVHCPGAPRSNENESLPS